MARNQNGCVVLISIKSQPMTKFQQAPLRIVVGFVIFAFYELSFQCAPMLSVCSFNSHYWDKSTAIKPVKKAKFHMNYKYGMLYISHIGE